MRLTILFICGLLFSGCAGMSKEACLHADWAAVGYEDGAAGLPVSAVSPRRASCARKAGVTVDMATYRAGREEGLRLFCEPSNGYAVGANGGAYQGVCAGPREPDFMAAYQAGAHLFNLKSSVSSLRAQARQAEYDLRNVEHSIAHTEAELVSPGVPGPDRLLLLAEMKTLFDEKKSIEKSMARVSRAQRLAENELSDYQAHLAYNGAYSRPVIEASQTSY